MANIFLQVFWSLKARYEFISSAGENKNKKKNGTGGRMGKKNWHRGKTHYTNAWGSLCGEQHHGGLADLRVDAGVLRLHPLKHRLGALLAGPAACRGLCASLGWLAVTVPSQKTNGFQKNYMCKQAHIFAAYVFAYLQMQQMHICANMTRGRDQLRNGPGRVRHNKSTEQTNGKLTMIFFWQ